MSIFDGDTVDMKPRVYFGGSILTTQFGLNMEAGGACSTDRAGYLLLSIGK